MTEVPGMPPVIGILGGSGLYDIDGLEERHWRTISSPFGNPSDDIMEGILDGQRVLFLPRHGRKHHLPPSAVNYRANIDALKRAGATEILSLSAVGSLKEEFPPGHFVIVDQFIDRTFSREKSFFGAGCVAHVALGDPVCTRLGEALELAAVAAGVTATRGGTYLAMEGPQFSTRAESKLYQSWDCDVIGMTNMPEAKLAREAELCYATVAMVTDYDCWHEGHSDVTVDAVIKVLHENAAKARAIVKEVVPLLAKRAESCHAGCQTALDVAIVTPPEARDPQLVGMLDAVAGRVLGG